MAQRRTSRRTAGSIRRLPSGRYQARVRADGGGLRAAPLTFSTKVEADRWLASAISAQADGMWIDPKSGKVSFGRFTEEWLRGKVDLAPKTRELYRYLLDRLILPTLGDVELVDLTPARVRAWRAALIGGGRPGPSTIAKAYRLLSSIIATAVVDNLVARNPCVEKGAGVERAAEIRVVSPEQVAAIATAIDPRYRALVLTAAYAGLRWGELNGLRQKNLDLLHRRISVVEQVVEQKDGTRLVCEPKTASGRRIVSLPAGLVDELEHHLAHFVRPEPEGLVFTGGAGGALRQSNFHNRHWRPALEEAGIDALRFHDLRHVAGTLATVSGATIREVQARLGHASPAAAYRYQHVLDSRDAEIAERLNTMFTQAARPS